MRKYLSLFLSLLCLVAYSECYNPLQKLRMMRKSRKFTNIHMEDVSNEKSSVYVAPQEGMKEADKIVKLPGQPFVKFSQYSGYVTVDPEAGRKLFYYFVEAEDPTGKPLVLWLNGACGETYNLMYCPHIGVHWSTGPGCSSLGYGALTELGPFRVNLDRKTLWYNPYAWNNVANVLFLESPAGVGFSYSNNKSDYVTDDERTAADTYTFLVNWFERFPEYKTQDLFLTGESYAGYYVPQLADLILKNNKITEHIVINLKGIAIGNADMDDTDWLVGMYDHLWTSALISKETHDGIMATCNFSSGENYSDTCKDYGDRANTEMGNIDIYNIYAPLCLNHSSPTAPSISSFDPCSDDYVKTYLNRHDVQEALHANITGVGGPWEICNDPMLNNWTDTPTVIPVIKKLMASDISVLIYSGDLDSVISVTSTKYSLAKIKAAVITPWYAWYSQSEVAGYAVGYAQNLTFATIRGAGHTVPSSQPQRALTLISSFLQGKLPPGPKNGTKI